MTNNLNDLTVKELRKIASEKKIPYSKRGKRFNKSELIEILEKEMNTVDTALDYKEKVLQAETESELVETEPVPPIDYRKSEEKINNFAEKYYQKIEKYAVKLATEKKAVIVSDLFEMKVNFCQELKNHLTLVSKIGEINRNTQNNYLSRILGRISNLVLENSESVPDDLLKKAFNQLLEGVKTEFRQDSYLRTVTFQSHLDERQEKIGYVEVKELIKWSQQTLSHLPEKPVDWKLVAIALMVATGRRASEIMATAEFSITPSCDKNEILFVGQTKGSDYDPTGYVIPVLAKPEHVIEGLLWLDFFGKRIKLNYAEATPAKIKKATKKAHQNFNRYLNEFLKGLLPEKLKVNSKDFWTMVFSDGKTKSRATTHLLRQIYGQVAFQVFFHLPKKGVKVQSALSQILGHQDVVTVIDEKTGQKLTRKSKAGEAYDADFELLDNIEELANLIVG